MARGKLFDAALFAAAELSDGAAALSLLHRMWGERLPAGYVAHGHVIRALCRAGRIQVHCCPAVSLHSLSAAQRCWPSKACCCRHWNESLGGEMPQNTDQLQFCCISTHVQACSILHRHSTANDCRTLMIS